MASSLVVGTDTYATLAECDTYLTNHYLSTNADLIAWNLLSDGNRDALLRAACIVIDRLPLVGYKATVTQTLQFPRTIWTEYAQSVTSVQIGDPSWYVQASVPTEVKYAQCEIALSLISGENVRLKMQREGVKSFSIGNLSETYKTASDLAYCNEANRLLNGYINGGARIC